MTIQRHVPRGSTRVRPTSVLLAVILVGITSGCSKDAPEEVESETVVPVVTVAAHTGAITATIRATGLVTPAPGAELLVVAPQPGRITDIPKAEGDLVHRGDVLVRFEIPSMAADAAKARAEIGRAEARLTTARAAQARMADLFARGVAARREEEEATREVADAEADLAGARAAADAADAIARRTVVRATFDGIVAKRSHNPGDLVDAAASDPVLRVIDPRRLEVTAAVPIADTARVRVGAPAHLADTASGAAAPALTVVSRPAAVEPAAVTVPVRLRFAAPAGYPAGTPVQIEIDAETHTGTVIVPAAALVHEDDEAAVFVVVDDKAQRRLVMTGLTSGHQVEITSGVTSGEAVIVSGQNGLPDGARVTTAAGAVGSTQDERPAATGRQ